MTSAYIRQQFSNDREITDRQRRILDYVTLVITRDDRGPSLREIADACGITTTSVVDYNIDRLVERGLLVRGGAYNEQRRVRLPVNPWRALLGDVRATLTKARVGLKMAQESELFRDNTIVNGALADVLALHDRIDRLEAEFPNA